MIIKPFGKGKKIVSINIEQKTKKYLKLFNKKIISDLSLEEGNHLFLTIIKDFKKGMLTLDELSVFAFEIFHNVAKKNPESELFFCTLSASELNFSVRSKGAYKNISTYLEDIDNFQKNVSRSN